MRKLICLLLAVLFVTPALADGITLEGTVVATRSAAVLAPAAGVVQAMLVQAGDHVTAGQEIAALMQTTVYAEISGTVSVCGESGESAETITNRYGAVVYIQPDARYTISASTKNAYDQLENKIIMLGEKVYVRSTEDSKRTGAGVVTAISDSDYTVELTQGNLAVSESVYIYRSAGLESTTRIGKGTATYCYPVAYTGTGAVSEILVEDGAYVTKGTPLFRTVDAASAYNNGIVNAVDGVVASLDVTPGTTVEAGALVATVYPSDAIRIEILADEIALRELTVGQAVTVNFINGVTAQGQVERISGIPYVQETTEEEDDEDDTVYFPVYVTFQTDAPIACGMTAKVTADE